MGLSFLLSIQNSIFLQSKNFLGVLGGWFALAGWVRQVIAPPIPPVDKHIPDPPSGPSTPMPSLQVFERERPSWVCHLAARAGVRASLEDPRIYAHSNVVGTTNVLEMARLYGCRSVAMASSSSVYGDRKVCADV